MPKQTQGRTTLERALARASADGEFRAEVLEDGRATQTACGLTDAEWRQLVPAVERIEHELKRDPRAATEVDHGEADAAGVKN